MQRNGVNQRGKVKLVAPLGLTKWSLRWNYVSQLNLITRSLWSAFSARDWIHCSK